MCFKIKWIFSMHSLQCMKFSLHAFLKHFCEMLNWVFSFPFLPLLFAMSLTVACCWREAEYFWCFLYNSNNTDSADVKASLPWNSYCSTSFHCGKSFLVTVRHRYCFGTTKLKRENSRIPTYFHSVTTCFILSSICITFEISSVPEEYFCGYTK